MNNISCDKCNSKLVSENMETLQPKFNMKKKCSCYSCYLAINKVNTDPCLKDEEIIELKAKN